MAYIDSNHPAALTISSLMQLYQAKEKLTSDTEALQSDTEKQKKIRSLLDNGEVS